MVFQNTLKAGGVIKCIVVPGCAEYTRKEVDDLTTFAKEQGAKGLATLALTAEGVKGTAQKFITRAEVEALRGAHRRQGRRPVPVYRRPARRGE